MKRVYISGRRINCRLSESAPDKLRESPLLTAFSKKYGSKILTGEV